MKFGRVFAGAAASLLLCLSIQAAKAGEYPHNHPGTAGLELNHGEKWATDAPLRKGISAIRAVLAVKLERIRRGTLPASAYGVLAETVQDNVNAIIANCKLPAEADAQLHVIIARVLEGNAAMKDGPDQAKRRGGALQIIAALDEYGTYFDHPGWQPLRQ